MLLGEAYNELRQKQADRAQSVEREIQAALEKLQNEGTIESRIFYNTAVAGREQHDRLCQSEMDLLIQSFDVHHQELVNDYHNEVLRLSLENRQLKGSVSLEEQFSECAGGLCPAVLPELDEEEPSVG